MTDWRVLVVDDEERYCELLRRALERDGFQVTTTTNGEMGMNLLLQGKVDLLVTDLDMPNFTGFDLVELAESIPNPPGILVVTAQKSMLEEGLGRLRKVQCLLKPFSLEDLRAKVGLLTGHWQMPAGSDSRPLPETDDRKAH